MKPLELWLPPEGAGTPVGCVATSFTFDGDFFENECLARFLSLGGAPGEGDHGSELALAIEREERLAEAAVTVLVDRSQRPEARNLRWDLLPVSAGPSVLLHAKVAVLLWQHRLRLVIGSANLTSAGYRTQVECVAGYDLGEQICDLPHEVAHDLIDEVALLVTDLVPERLATARRRALDTLEAARRHVELAPPPELGRLRLAVAPVRPGRRALDGRSSVWNGPAPRSCTVLSPFWDEHPGTADQNGVAAVASHLSTRRRNGKDARAEVLVTVEILPGGRIVRAPRAVVENDLGNITVEARLFEPDEPHRRLHAKWITYRNDDWIAVMFGSSNITAAGLGLRTNAHRELNLWIGAPLQSAEGRGLDATVQGAGPIDLADPFEPEPDEDESFLDDVPHGFVAALLDGQGDGLRLTIVVDPSQLPERWSLHHPDLDGAALMDSAELVVPTTHTAGTYLERDLAIDRHRPPTVVVVRWTRDGADHEGTLAVLVEDHQALPSPSALRNLSVDQLLWALASTRPLRALAAAERRARQTLDGEPGGDPLDPLKRHVLTTSLVPRVRRHSAGLWGLRNRLGRPMSNSDTLEWRLRGALGPLYLAKRLVDEAAHSAGWVPGEASFLLAELALTVGRAEWQITGTLQLAEVERSASECIEQIRTLADELDDVGAVAHLREYSDVAFAQVQR